MTSASILYLYLKDWKPNINITYTLHTGKQHGLEDQMDYFLSNKDIDLVVVPDAGSNDFQYIEQLKELSIPVLILDHHILETEVSSNCVIINNQVSQKYRNKALTGAGVVWQFCRYIDSQIQESFADKYIDLAALGTIGDMGNVAIFENRYIIKRGLDNIKNFFFSTLIDKQSYSMADKINPTTVAFYIVPLINAMIRVGTQEEKERLFEAFINGKKKVISNKRGAKGETTYLAYESARECTNAKARQNKIKDKAVEELEIKIYKYDLLENKVLFVRLDDDNDFPSELNGLVANQLANKFYHPTIIARLNEDGQIRGSARGLNQSGLDSFKNFMMDSGYFEYALGHDNACGCSISNKDLSAFHTYANEKLKDIDFSENVFNVNFCEFAAQDNLQELVMELGSATDIYGQGLPEPLIYVQDINLSSSDIEIIGKNKDTLKFTKFGITYIRFHAKDMIEDLSKYSNMKINLVGKANINEWMGNVTPQIFIEEYEVEDNTYGF